MTAENFEMDLGQQLELDNQEKAAKEKERRRRLGQALTLRQAGRDDLIPEETRRELDDEIAYQEDQRELERLRAETPRYFKEIDREYERATTPDWMKPPVLKAFKPIKAPTDPYGIAEIDKRQNERADEEHRRRLRMQLQNSDGTMPRGDRFLSQKEVENEAKEKGDKGFWSTVAEEFSTAGKVAEKVPVLGSILKLSDARQWSEMEKRMSNPDRYYRNPDYDPDDPFSEEYNDLYWQDQELLTQRANKQAVEEARERAHPIRAMGGKIAAEMPTFAGEMALTSGLATRATGSLVHATKLFKAAAASQGIKWLSKKVGRGIVLSAIQSTLMPQRTLEAYQRFHADRFAVTQDELGQLDVIMTRHGDSTALALWKGWLDTFKEVLSEHTGEAMTWGAGKLISKVPMPKKVANVLLGLIGEHDGGGAFSKLMSATSTQPLFEGLEERAGGALEVLFGIDEREDGEGYGDRFGSRLWHGFWPGWDQIRAEAVGFMPTMLLGGGAAVVGDAVRNFQDRPGRVISSRERNLVGRARRKVESLPTWRVLPPEVKGKIRRAKRFDELDAAMDGATGWLRDHSSDPVVAKAVNDAQVLGRKERRDEQQAQQEEIRRRVEKLIESLKAQASSQSTPPEEEAAQEADRLNAENAENEARQDAVEEVPAEGAVPGAEGTSVLADAEGEIDPDNLGVQTDLGFDENDIASYGQTPQAGQTAPESASAGATPSAAPVAVPDDGAPAATAPREVVEQRLAETGAELEKFRNGEPLETDDAPTAAVEAAAAQAEAAAGGPPAPPGGDQVVPPGDQAPAQRDQAPKQESGVGSQGSGGGEVAAEDRYDAMSLQQLQGEVRRRGLKPTLRILGSPRNLRDYLRAVDASGTAAQQEARQEPGEARPAVPAAPQAEQPWTESYFGKRRKGKEPRRRRVPKEGHDYEEFGKSWMLEELRRRGRAVPKKHSPKRLADALRAHDRMIKQGQARGRAQFRPSVPNVPEGHDAGEYPFYFDFVSGGGISYPSDKLREADNRLPKSEQRIGGEWDAITEEVVRSWPPALRKFFHPVSSYEQLSDIAGAADHYSEQGPMRFVGGTSTNEQEPLTPDQLVEKLVSDAQRLEADSRSAISPAQARKNWDAMFAAQPGTRAVRTSELQVGDRIAVPLPGIDRTVELVVRARVNGMVQFEEIPPELDFSASVTDEDPFFNFLVEADSDSAQTMHVLWVANAREIEAAERDGVPDRARLWGMSKEEIVEEMVREGMEDYERGSAKDSKKELIRQLVGWRNRNGVAQVTAETTGDNASTMHESNGALRERGMQTENWGGGFVQGDEDISFDPSELEDEEFQRRRQEGRTAAGDEELQKIAERLGRSLGARVTISAEPPDWVRRRGVPADADGAADLRHGRIWLRRGGADAETGAHEGGHLIKALAEALARDGDAAAKAAVAKFQEAIDNAPETVRQAVRDRYGAISGVELFSLLFEEEQAGRLQGLVEGPNAQRGLAAWWKRVKRLFSQVWQEVRRTLGRPLKLRDVAAMDWPDAIRELNNAMRAGQRIVGENGRALDAAAGGRGGEGREVVFRQSQNKRPYYQIPFAESLREVVKPGSTVRENVYVRDTPQVLQDIGMTALPIMASPRHLRLNYYDDAEFMRHFGTLRAKEHAHGLGIHLEALPKLLEHPVAVIANLTPNARPGSVAVLTTKVVNGKRVVVPILVEAQVQADGEAVDSHLVLTVYDKADWVGSLLRPAIEAEKKGIGVFYVDARSAGKINALSGLVKGVGTSGIAHTIDEPGSPVKGIFKKQTDTAQFRRWFGESKAVDANGKALVVWRRDPTPIDRFDPSKAQQNDAGWLGKGLYFYGDQHEAEAAVGYGKHLRPFYIRAENPYFISEEEYNRLVEDNDPEASAAFTERLREEGYDSVYWNGDLRQEWMVFDSSQAKLAEGNHGTFDLGNDEFAWSRRGVAREASWQGVLDFGEDVLDGYAERKGIAPERRQALKEGLKKAQRFAQTARKAWERAFRIGANAEDWGKAFATPEANRGEYPTVSRVLRELYERKDSFGAEVRGLRLESAEDVAGMMMALRSPFQEMFKVVFVDGQNRVLDARVVHIGTANASLAHPTNTLGDVPAGAKGFYISHNHPSGDPTPSNEDMALTDRFREIGRLMGIRLRDHVVTDGEFYYSFSGHERRALPAERQGHEDWEIGVGRNAHVIARPASAARVAALARQGANVPVVLAMGQKADIRSVRLLPEGFFDRKVDLRSPEVVRAIFGHAQETGATSAIIVLPEDRLDRSVSRFVTPITDVGRTLAIPVVDIIAASPRADADFRSYHANFPEYFSSAAEPGAQEAREGEAPPADGERRLPSRPWPADFPNVVVHTTRQAVERRHATDFARAKAGDRDAAARIVHAVAKPERIRALAARHPGAIVVPVHAEEATGRNKIPMAYASLLADAGMELATDIVQSVRAERTGKDAWYRMTHRPEFDGPVQAGREYVLVDDHVTQGGTLSALRQHIESHGGKVVEITSLTASRFSATIALQPTTLARLRAKLGKELEHGLQEANIAASFEALTESEARYLLQLSPDTLRDRIAEERRTRGGGLLQGQVQGPSGEVNAAQGEKAESDAEESTTGDGDHAALSPGSLRNLLADGQGRAGGDSVREASVPSDPGRNRIASAGLQEGAEVAGLQRPVQVGDNAAEGGEGAEGLGGLENLDNLDNPGERGARHGQKGGKAARKGESTVKFSRSGLYTGSAADYAHRREDGTVENGPSLHKVGTGEGAQAYGWGLYASERRGVAEGYAGRAVMDVSNFVYKLEDMPDCDWNMANRVGAAYQDAGTKDFEKIVRYLRETKGAHSTADWMEKHRSDMERLAEETLEKSHVYEQTLFTNLATPEETERHLLKWYEPVSEEQKQWIVEQARKEGASLEKDAWGRSVLAFHGKNLLVDDWTKGEVAYNGLARALGSEQAASEFLARAGIDGVKYPVDSFGKTVKNGDEVGWNYVSFRDDNIRVDHKWRDGKMEYQRVGEEASGVGRERLEGAAQALEKSLGVTVEISADMPDWAREQSRGETGDIRAAIDPATGRVWLSSRLADEGSAAHEGAHWVDALTRAAAASGDPAAKAAVAKFAEVVANCPESLRKRIEAAYGEATDSEIFAHMAEEERNGNLGKMLAGEKPTTRTWWQKVKRAFALIWQALRRMFGAPLKASALGKMDWRDALHQMSEAMRTGQRIEVGERGIREGGVQRSLDSLGGLDTLEKVKKAARGLDGANGTELATVVRLVNAIGAGARGEVAKLSGRHFRFARTNDILVKSGLTGDYFTIRAGVILRHEGKDTGHAITPAEWVAIADALSNRKPLLVEKYKGLDNSFRIWTQATIGGKTAIVGAVVRNAGKNIDVNSIQTVFGAGGAQPKIENIVYPETETEIRSVLIRHNSGRYTVSPKSSDGSLAQPGGGGNEIIAPKSGAPRNLGSLDHLDNLAEGEPRRNGPVQFSRTLPEESETPEEKAAAEKKPTQGELPGVQWRPRSSKVSVLNGVETYDDAELVGMGGWFTAKVVAYQGKDGKRWALKGADGKIYVKNIETEEQARWHLGHRRAEMARSVDALAGADKETVVRIAEARNAFLKEVMRQEATKADKVEAVHQLMRDLKIDDSLWKQEANEVMRILREHPIYGRNTAAADAMRFVETVLAREACRIRERRVNEIFKENTGKPKYKGGPRTNETRGLKAAQRWALNKDNLSPDELAAEQERLMAEALRLEDILHNRDLEGDPRKMNQAALDLARCYEDLAAIRKVGGLFTFHDPDAKQNSGADGMPARDYLGDLRAWDEALEWLEGLVHTSAVDAYEEHERKEKEAKGIRDRAIDELLPPGEVKRIDNINDLKLLNSSTRKKLYNAIMFFKTGIDAGFSLAEQMVYDKNVGFGEGVVHKLIAEVEDAQHAEAQRNEDSEKAIGEAFVKYFGKDPAKSFKDKFAFDRLIADARASRRGATEVKKRKLVKNEDGSFRVEVLTDKDGKPECFEQTLAELMPAILWRRQAEEAAGCTYEQFVEALCNKKKLKDIDFEGRPEEARRFGMMWGLAKTGLLPETIDEAANLLKKKGLLNLVYVVSDLFNQGYDELDEMCRYMYGASLTKVPFYCPAKREFYRMAGPEGPAGLESFMSMLSSFIRERTDNGRSFELYDIFDRLIADTHRKNHMITHYRIVDKARRVFQHPDMQRALVQRFGERAAGNIDEYWNTIARGSHQVANRDVWYRISKGIATAYAASQIPRLTTAIKQLASPTATMAMMPEDMTTAQYFKWMLVIQSPKERERYKALMDRLLPGWRWRLKGNINEAMRTVLESGDGKRYRELVRAAKNIGAKPTTWADAWACVTGSYPIFRYWHDKLVGEGKSEAEANKEAMRQVSRAYNETQQSALASYMGAVQSNRYLVWAMMFKSAPVAYTRLLYAHARALAQGRGNKMAHVRAILGLFIAQSAWLLAGGSVWGMMGGGDGDDDDDSRTIRKLLKTAGRALVELPTAGLPGGTVATYLWDKFVEGKNMYGRDPIEIGAPLAVVDSAVNIIDELFREDGPRAGRLGSSLADVVGAITQLPIPGLFATTSGAIDAFTADSDELTVPQRIGRSLGYSRQAVGAH